ncbi:helix-turn-helix domain-containing protein [Jeongeupia wiesaeckerbachi]|uniref:helix-turn-helix domain-containing protein n=1 Tax=Jeongeupia wiesaeckerbachi TaxID=3051218 RepID=UPI003D8013DD
MRKQNTEKHDLRDWSPNPMCRSGKNVPIDRISRGPDRYAQALHGVNGRLLQTTRSDAGWLLSRQVHSGIVLQQAMHGGTNLVEGEGEAGWLTVFLPDVAGQYVFNGQPVVDEALVLLAPGTPLVIQAHGVASWSACSVPLTDVTTQLGEYAAQRLVLQSQTAMLQRRPGSSALCRSMHVDGFWSLLAALAGGPVPRRPQAATGRSRLPRRGIIRDMLTYLAAGSGEAICVGQLAAEAGVSERTLRAMFAEVFGVTPSGYLRLRQLNAFRRALCAPRPEEHLVSTVAARVGITEPGRFAGYYRALFGEYPADTLRAHQRRR